MSEKHVRWAPDTKTHDGNPKYRIRYDKLTQHVLETFPKSVKSVDDDKADANDDDMTWRDYCSPKLHERCIVAIIE